MSEIIAIVSAKGGTGKTSMATNFAAALSEREKQVLLLDLNIGSAGPEVLFGLQKRAAYNIVDVLDGNCKIIQAILNIPEYENLKLLPAGRTNATSGVTWEKIQKLLLMFREHFDYVVVDVPTYPQERFFDVVELADRVIWVSDVSTMSVMDTVAAKYAVSQEVMKKSSLLLNKIRSDLVKEELLDLPEQQVKEIGIPLLGMVSYEEEILLQSETNYKIISLKKPACSAFFRMAGRLEGEKIPFSLKV